MPPTNNHGLTFSDSDSNSTYAPKTYHGFPSGFGSIKIVATMETTGLVPSIKVNSPFTRSSDQSERFTKAIIAKQLIIVRGMSDNYPDHCNGFQEDRVTIIGGNEAVVSVSPNGEYDRQYADYETVLLFGIDGSKRSQRYYNSNYNYGNNFIWVPPKTLFEFHLDKHKSFFNTLRTYKMYNGSDKYVCYHINRIERLWSMKIKDGTVKLRTQLTLDTTPNEMFIRQLNNNEKFIEFLEPTTDSMERILIGSDIKTELLTTLYNAGVVGISFLAQVR
jgi:hypothetical protein